MVKVPKESGRLDSWIRGVLRMEVGFAAELQLCHLLSERFPKKYLRSLESSPKDGGLFLKDSFREDQPHLQRHEDLQNLSDPGPFVPIEIKTILPRIRADWACIWTINTIVHKRNTGILLLTSPAESERIAVVPMPALFQHSKVQKDTQKRTCLVVGRGSYQYHAPAFPPELAPYVMEMSDLHQALNDIIAVKAGSGDYWCNPANKVRFDPENLITSTNTSLLSYGKISENSVRLLHAQFRECKSSYEVRTNGLAPLFGDCHIFDTKSKKVWFVEIKETHMKIKERDVYHTVKGRSGTPFFSWRQRRDFLLSRSGDDTTLLLPWRCLPDEWCDASYQDKATAAVDRSKLEPFLVQWPRQRQDKARIHTFLQHFIDLLEITDPITSHVTSDPGVDLPELPPKLIDSSIDENDSEVEEVVEDQKISEPTNADLERQALYTCKAASAFNRVLIKSRKFCMKDAGPAFGISRYYICRRSLPEAAQQTSEIYNFSHISPGDCLIPVRFIQLKYDAYHAPKFHADYNIENWGPGILILDCYNQDRLYEAHGRFVGDSRDFPSAPAVHDTRVILNHGLVCEDIQTVEHPNDSRYVVKQIRSILTSNRPEEPPPVQLGSAVVNLISENSRYCSTADR